MTNPGLLVLQWIVLPWFVLAVIMVRTTVI